jgi:8-hydroxy-5-deazaflavin:NADPH oxidoreductase
MTTLGLIGAGNIGGTVARLAVAAGIDVIVANSRGPQTLAGLVGELGPRASAATAAEAAQAGDLIVVSVPLHACDQLPAMPAGRTVIDTCNYYPDRDGHIPELDSGAVTSSVLLARLLPAASVVKAFNNIDFVHLGTLARPSGAPDRSALPVAADDAGARDRVAALLDALGYDAVDIGPLAESWRSQPGTPVYVQPYMSPAPEGDMTREERGAWFMSSPGTPVPTDEVRQLVDSAVPVGG